MRRSASKLPAGALAGLAFGGILAGTAVLSGSVDFDSRSLAIRILGFLIAVPPFIYTPLLSLPFGGALVVIPVWWMVVGVFLAALAGRRGAAGVAIGVIGIGLLAVGHLLARNAIVAELDTLEAAISALAKEFGALE